MAKTPEPDAPQPSGKIVVDGAFLRAQAMEAVETFFAPLAGVYAAARGERVQVTRRRRKAKKAA